jgi:hypothetical protein
MGFLPVYPFIGLAERAVVLLDTLHKIKDDPLLVVTGMKADRTKLAYFRQGFIQ